MNTRNRSHSLYHTNALTNHQLVQHNTAQPARLRPNSRARHPEYVDKSQRLASFTFWRHSHVQDPYKLAGLGFFFTGEADLVRCYFCSLGLKDFIASDDPLREHVRYSGDCDFLVQYLGPSRLYEIKNSIRSEGLPVSQRGEVHQTLPNNSQPEERTGGSYHQNRNTQHPHNLSHLDHHNRDHKNYRHPEYSSYQVRVASFTGWPRDLVQTPEQLAVAGFYYTGTCDIVRCYACDGGLEKWDPTDDPWIEHCINFPHCIHLRETKGQEYITLALYHHRQRTTEQASASNIQDISSQLNGVNISEHTNERSTVIKTIVEMGFKQADAEGAVDRLRRDRRDVTVESVIDEIQLQNNDQKLPSLTSKELIAEQKRLKEELYCMFCTTADINILFLPCQHHRVCKACADSLTNCPLCGQHISQKIRTYRP